MLHARLVAQFSLLSFSKHHNYEAPLMKGEREDEVELTGTEVNFTLFRNVETGAVVELVDTEDVPGLAGSRDMRLCAMHHGSMRLCIYASAYLLCPASQVGWGYGSDKGYGSMRLSMYPCIQSVSLVLGNHSGWGYAAIHLSICVSLVLHNHSAREWISLCVLVPACLFPVHNSLAVSAWVCMLESVCVSLPVSASISLRSLCGTMCA